MLSQGPVLRTGRTLQGVKTAIALPVADLEANRAKVSMLNSWG